MRWILFILCWMTFDMGMAQDITLDWRFIHPRTNDWIELGEKGSVQEALMAIGELPDPFYGVNEKKFNWVEEHYWEFRSIVFLDSSQIDRDFLELEFGSIDTYGRVFVNNQFVDSTENAFIPHSFQVKEYLKYGVNEIKVIITPPVKFHREAYEEAKYHLPAPNDPHEIAIAPYTRKPQYQFGWDWSLRMVTMGFNKPAVLHAYDHNRIYNKSAKVTLLSKEKGAVRFDLYVNGLEDGKLLWESELFGEKEIEIIDGKLTRTAEVEKPHLWWPRGFGDPYIYHDVVKIKSTDNKLIDSVQLNFGFKHSELVQEEDTWGTSYYFRINDERIFCKGANYIPQDVFPARITEEETREMVRLMAESNFNMVRVWGGGFYQSEAFYDECDKQGIMVWQDLMFACSMYPGDSAFLENVRKELNYQVPRISGHPSIMLFNGNNEVDIAWHNWGFQIKYGLYGASAREIEKAYDDLFKQLAPSVVEELTSIPYIHTSPLSNWGKKELYNHGSQHYWGVWHGKDPIEDFGKKIGRFNAEYGFQSFPEFNTLRSFSTKADWDISSEVMKQHQKSYVGNDMILKHAKRLYGKPEDFKQFVYYSQLTQSLAVSMAVAGHRIDAPRCGGTLYWQLNDCWPVSSWSSTDYYNNKKALQYRIKDDYLDVSVVEKFNDLEDRDYYLVVNSLKRVNVDVAIQEYNLKGKLQTEWKRSFERGLKGVDSEILDWEESKKCSKPKSRLIRISWTYDGTNHERSFVQINSSRYKPAERSDFTVELLDVDENNKTATLKITNDRFLRDFWITSSDFGIQYESNFVNLLPGEHTISISFDKTPKEEDFQYFWH